MICKSWGSILGKRERSPYRPGVSLGKIGVTAATALKFWSFYPHSPWAQGGGGALCHFDVTACAKTHRLEKSSIGMFSILVGAIVGAVVGAVVRAVVRTVVGTVVGAEVGGVVGGVVGAVVGALVGLAPHAEGAVVVVAIIWPYM